MIKLNVLIIVLKVILKRYNYVKVIIKVHKCIKVLIKEDIV